MRYPKSILDVYLKGNPRTGFCVKLANLPDVFEDMPAQMLLH